MDYCILFVVGQQKYRVFFFPFMFSFIIESMMTYFPLFSLNVCFSILLAMAANKGCIIKDLLFPFLSLQSEKHHQNYSHT
jgi:hypothetical protein